MGRSFVPGDFEGLGASGGDFVKSLANDVTNKVCNLYKNHPLGFIENPLSSNPVSDFNQGLWDSLCGSLPEPLLPENPSGGITGGQCCNKEYDVTISYEAFSFSGGSCQPQSFGTFDLTVRRPGKITAVRTSEDGRIVEIVVTDCNGVVTVTEATQRDNFCRQLRGFSIAIAPGFGVDDCGDVPPSYPGGPPPANNPYTYTHDPGNGRPTIDTNYEIDFFPDFRGPLVRFPDLPNICLAFTAFGVEFDLCTNKPGEGVGGDIDALADKLDQLQDSIDEVADAADELANREPTQDTPPDALGDEEGEEPNSLEECVSGLRFVRVVLTEVPPNANVETGLGGEDLIDDAGWLSFRVGGSLLPPQRILFADSLFEAPEGVECFSLKLNFGFKASVSKVVKADD